MATLEQRRNLRRFATDAERVLWQHLRGRSLAGARFRRQHPLGPYVLDFYCAEARLCIEADGGQHWDPEQQTYDAARTAQLAAVGIRVLRFRNREILQERDAVLTAIAAAVKRGAPSP